MEKTVNVIDSCKESMVKLYYGLTGDNLVPVRILFRELLSCLYDSSDARDLLKLLFKMIAQTRDIRNGKGERSFTYMMIYEWYLIQPDLAIRALEACVGVRNDGCDVIRRVVPDFQWGNGYGCWKDIKYFCGYVRSQSPKGEDDPLIRIAMTLLNQQLYLDWISVDDEKRSLSCKWVPREKSKYKWLFQKMAMQWSDLLNPRLFSCVEEGDSYIRARNQCMMKYRQVLSSMNKKMDIAEVKQCAKRWREIRPVTFTMDGVTKRKLNAYLNVNNAMEDVRCDVIDRYLCGHYAKEFFQMGNIRQSSSFSNDGRHSFVPGDFVKRAVSLLNLQKDTTDLHILQNILYQMELLNKQWAHFVKNCEEMDVILPVIDMSLSMSGDAMYHAMGMACVVAQKSKIRNRLLIMDHVPTWITADDSADFLSMIRAIEMSVNSHTSQNVGQLFSFLLGQISSDDVLIGFPKITAMIFSNSGICKAMCESAAIRSLMLEKMLVKGCDMRVVWWNCGEMGGEVFDQVDEKVGVMLSGTNAYLLSSGSTGSAFSVVEDILNQIHFQKMELIFDDYYANISRTLD